MFSAKHIKKESQDSKAVNFACDDFICAFRDCSSAVFQKSGTLLAWMSSRHLVGEEDWGRDGKNQIQADHGMTIHLPRCPN